jgi:hypothetical protein
MYDTSLIPVRISLDSRGDAERLRQRRGDLNKRLEERGLKVEIEEAPDAAGLYNLDPHTIHLLFDISKAAAASVAGALAKEVIVWLFGLMKSPKKDVKIEIGISPIHLKANSSEQDLADATSSVAIAIGKSVDG